MSIFHFTIRNCWTHATFTFDLKAKDEATAISYFKQTYDPACKIVSITKI